MSLMLGMVTFEGRKYVTDALVMPLRNAYAKNSINHMTVSMSWKMVDSRRGNSMSHSIPTTVVGPTNSSRLQ